MSFDELRRLWPNWSKKERHEFCRAAPWLRGQVDFPDMLRFMMRDRDPGVCDEIALAVAETLPQDESFSLLSEALVGTENSRGANIIQAIAVTRHAGALALIRARLDSIIALPEIWDDLRPYNRFAFVAICSVEYLLRLGAAPSDFEALVRALSKHRNAATADTCRNYLRSQYPVLLAPEAH